MELRRLYIALFSILSLCFAGCSDDASAPSVIEPVPELKLENESVKVKIGSDNKIDLTIQQGAGEYSAFSLNESIATAVVDGNKVVIEAIANGKTAVVISDGSSSYRKVNVLSFTTDKMELSANEIKIDKQLGSACEATAEVLKGNGKYTISSDNEGIKAAISKEGKITISGKALRDEQKAVITVTDGLELTEEIAVTIVSNTIAYTPEELEAIKQVAEMTYIYNKVNTLLYTAQYATYINKYTDNTQTYGWEIASNNTFWNISYSGDKTVGKKENAKMDAMFSVYDPVYGSATAWFSDQEVDLEIIKNDGNYIWTVFSFVRNEKLNYGYFCDKIEPAAGK